MELRTIGRMAVMVLVALGLAGAALADERYSDRVRFEAGEHPRIFLTQDDLPELRARVAPGGTHHREFERLKALMDEQIELDDEGNISRGNLFSSTASAFLYLPLQGFVWVTDSGCRLRSPRWK